MPLLVFTFSSHILKIVSCFSSIHLIWLPLQVLSLMSTFPYIHALLLYVLVLCHNFTDFLFLFG